MDNNNNNPDHSYFLSTSNSTPIEPVDPQGPQLPYWADTKLVQEGREFIRHNFFSVFFAHFISLIFLLCYGPVRYILYLTGKSDSASKSLDRYFSTLLHVKLWYEGDILNPGGEAFKDIVKVRRIHSGVSCRVQNSCQKSSKCFFLSNNYDDFEDIQDETEIIKLREAIRSDLGLSQKCPDCGFEKDPNRFPITQLDMSVTQFCFMGFVSMFPHKMGIVSTSPKNVKGLEGFIHIWAVIGHILGIRDEFNICLPQNQELNQIIWGKVLRPEFLRCDLSTIKLWTWLIDGLWSVVYFISLKSVLLFVLQSFFDVNVNKGKLVKMLNLYQLICFRLMSMCFSSWLSCDDDNSKGGISARTMFNSLLRLAIWLTHTRLRILKFTLRNFNRFTKTSKLKFNCESQKF